jgi:hypothetical protein
MRRSAGHRLGYIALTPFLIATAFAGVFPASYRVETLDLRGKAQSLAVYDAPGAPRRVQVIVTSGDLGWVGLSVDVAEHIRNKGYRVVGFNARAYLASFTGRNLVLNESDVPGDFAAVLEWAARSGPPAAVLVGVSEGAGLSVIAMGSDRPTRCKGLIALGLPETTSLGWRWTDFPMWITKKDPKEPMAQTRPYMSRLRMPLAMIHSTHDEWDPIERISQLFLQAPDPKRFIPVDASNHRFSDKVPQVLENVDQSLQWIESLIPYKDSP